MRLDLARICTKKLAQVSSTSGYSGVCQADPGSAATVHGRPCFKFTSTPQIMSCVHEFVAVIYSSARDSSMADVDLSLVFDVIARQV